MNYETVPRDFNKSDWQSMNKSYESPLKTPFYHSIHRNG